MDKFFRSYGTDCGGTKEKSPQEELVEDTITIISHFAGKLYAFSV